MNYSDKTESTPRDGIKCLGTVLIGRGFGAVYVITAACGVKVGDVACLLAVSVDNNTCGACGNVDGVYSLTIGVSICLRYGVAGPCSTEVTIGTVNVYVDITPAERIGELEASAGQRIGIVNRIVNGSINGSIPCNRNIYGCTKLIYGCSGSVYIVTAAAGIEVGDIVGPFASHAYTWMSPQPRASEK